MAIWMWIRREVLHVLPIFLFFLFFFTLINSIETYLFERNGIEGFRFLQIFLAAALIAKIVLVVDHLPLIKRFKKYPLAYNILWKTFFYWSVLFLVRVLVRFVPFFWSDIGHPYSDFKIYLEKVEWNVFLSIQAYYLMLLFIFVVFQELIYKIGVKKAHDLFFGK